MQGEIGQWTFITKEFSGNRP